MHDPVRALEIEIGPLDARLKPIADSSVDINDPNWVKKIEAMDPLDQAGIHPQAQTLLEKVVENYCRASTEDRQRIRDLFRCYSAFAWAAALPHRPTTKERFRQHLLHFSIVDQGNDSRDAILLLQGLCAQAAKAGIDLGTILKEVAVLSSNQDKYGMGSTAEQLRRAG